MLRRLNDDLRRFWLGHRNLFYVGSECPEQSQVNSDANNNVGSTDLANSLLGDLFTVYRVDITNVVVYPDDDDNLAIIVGATVGGFFGLVCLIGMVLVLKKKMNSTKVEA